MSGIGSRESGIERMPTDYRFPIPDSRLLSVHHPGDFFDLVRLDDVPDLDVLVFVEPDSALETLFDFGHVVLEAPERTDLALVDHAVVPQQSHFGGPADRAFRDDASRPDAA